MRRKAPGVTLDHPAVSAYSTTMSSPSINNDQNGYAASDPTWPTACSETNMIAVTLAHIRADSRPIAAATRSTPDPSTSTPQLARSTT